MKVVDRFLQYVKFDTQSDELTNLTPSTPGQMIFARHLEKELNDMGLKDVTLDDNGYLMATLPGNTGRAGVPTVGFIAHLDTSPDMSGRHVSPRIVENYQGGDIALNAEKRIVLSPSEFPELNNYIGQDLIVTDGNTLLGADDKAGIAEIITAVDYLMHHPEIKHGDIRIAFNPDEEIGKGAHHFDVEKFGCEWAYTMDGGDIGELEYECFNAAAAKIVIHGVSVHTGYAKGKMINAARLAAEFNALIPTTDIPEATEGYEGFYHLLSIEGHCEEGKLSYIIRDHDRQKFEQRKKFLADCVAKMNEKYGEGVFEITLTDQYYNMKEKIEPCMFLIENAKRAMEQLGIEPKVVPIRGGTDGAQLSYRGLPCPNIFAGGVNFHGPYEFVSIQVMEKAMQVVIKISELAAGYND